VHLECQWLAAVLCTRHGKHEHVENNMATNTT